MIKIGYAITGSFCTIRQTLEVMKDLVEKGYDVHPIISFNVGTMDTRFINHDETIEKLIEITGKKPISTIQEAEPIGPKKMFDVIVVAPCTGNTMAKLANSITDTPVLMACKSQLRNSKPVVLAIATNDALSGNAKNIGVLLATRNLYFVPFGQDDPHGKPRSMIAEFSLIEQTILKAIQGEQLQPLLLVQGS